MRRASQLVWLYVVLLCTTASAQYVSYWFQGWQRNGDAADAQAYFMRAGTNIVFTYASNRVYINASGTITNIAATTNAVYAQFATNWLGSNSLYLLLQTNSFATNSYFSVWSTNWANSNSMWISVTNAIFDATNGLSFSQTNIYATNLIGLVPGTNIYFATNGSGFLEINASNQTVAVLDIRTNNFNEFKGTNNFNKEVGVMGRFGLNFTNFYDAAYAGYSFIWRRLSVNQEAPPGGVALLMGGNPGWVSPGGNPLLEGITISSRYDLDAVSSDKPLFITGGPVMIGSLSANVGVGFYAVGECYALVGSDGNFYVQKHNPANGGLFGSTFGGIMTTNFIHSKNSYMRANRGFVLNSNSWVSVPTFAPAGSSDAFNEGDNWYVSSNGYPYVLFKLNDGTLHTNIIFGDTNVWLTSGNKLGGAGPFLGSTDNQQLQFKVNNAQVGLFSTVPSIALGGGSIAAGANAVGIGYPATASGANSLSLGVLSESTQPGATAVGASAHAHGVGATSVGQGATAAGDSSVALGDTATANGLSSFCSGSANIADGDYSVALGAASCHSVGVASFALGVTAVANNDGSFVWSDSNGAGYSDNAANQFIVYASGGIDLHAAGAGVFTDGPVNSTNTIHSRNTGSVEPYTYYASNNGNRGPSGQMPLGCWGCLSAYGTATRVNGGNAVTQSTYYPITNFTYSVTNHFVAHPNPSTLQSGWITNVFAGYYRISFQVSCSAAANDQLEVDVSTNNVTSDVIAGHSSTGSGASRTNSISGNGILYLPASTYIGIKIQNISSTAAITIDHAQLTIGSP